MMTIKLSEGPQEELCIKLKSLYQDEPIYNIQTYLDLTSKNKELIFDISIQYRALFLKYTNLPIDVINIIYDYESIFLDKLKETLYQEDLTSNDVLYKEILTSLACINNMKYCRMIRKYIGDITTYDFNNLGHTIIYFNYKVINHNECFVQSLLITTFNNFINDGWFSKEEILSKLITFYSYYKKIDKTVSIFLENNDGNNRIDFSKIFDQFIYGDVHYSYNRINPIFSQIENRLEIKDNKRRGDSLENNVQKKKLKL